MVQAKNAQATVQIKPPTAGGLIRKPGVRTLVSARTSSGVYTLLRLILSFLVCLHGLMLVFLIVVVLLDELGAAREARIRPKLSPAKDKTQQSTPGEKGKYMVDIYKDILYAGLSGFSVVFTSQISSDTAYTVVSLLSVVLLFSGRRRG